MASSTKPLVACTTQPPPLPGFKEELQDLCDLLFLDAGRDFAEEEKELEAKELQSHPQDSIKERLGQETRDAVRALVVFGHPVVDGAVMDRFPNLQVISNYGVGINHINVADAHARKIPVGNTPDVLSDTTADMGFALLLAAARNVVVGDAYARRPDVKSFGGNLLLGAQVSGRTIGIVGMGRIGSSVARRARGFDMSVLYHNRTRVGLEQEEALQARFCSLPELLRLSDFVVLVVPVTKETTGLISMEQFKCMKKSAILVNIARGLVVNHDDLTKALREGLIAGAALDVTEPEPLPRDHPLLSQELQDRVIITPHLGSATVETRLAMGRVMLENLKAGLQGKPLPSAVTL